MRFLPVVFYGSILLIVGLWLRPLLRDLRVLTTASQKFATDYREPLEHRLAAPRSSPVWPPTSTTCRPA